MWDINMWSSEGFINQNEMIKLAIGLDARGYKLKTRSALGGLQIACDKLDAVCNKYSYGHENGLIEIMGLPQCEDDVIGYLTANEVLALIDADVQKKCGAL